jgi:hypothetical protein
MPPALLAPGHTALFDGLASALAREPVPPLRSDRGVVGGIRGVSRSALRMDGMWFLNRPRAGRQEQGICVQIPLRFHQRRRGHPGPCRGKGLPLCALAHGQADGQEPPQQRQRHEHQLPVSPPSALVCPGSGSSLTRSTYPSFSSFPPSLVLPCAVSSAASPEPSLRSEPRWRASRTSTCPARARPRTPSRG